MKKTSKTCIFALSVAILLFILCSYSKSDTVIKTKNTDDLTEVSTYSYGTTNTASFEHSSQAAYDIGKLNNTISYYSDLYGAEYVYQDSCINQKFILIGKEYIVELFTVEGLNQTKVIKINNIERIERNSLPEFDEIKIYDKTNQCISAFVNSKEADEILKSIDTSV